MVSRNEITGFLNGILKPENYSDITFNGLQIEGGDLIGRIAFSVDSGYDIFVKAVELKCDMLIVHHGLIWNGLKKITGIDKKRIDILLRNNINLYVSHLPLDKHPQIGNNIQILKSLGAIPDSDFGEAAYIGKFENPLNFNELINQIKDKIGRRIDFLQNNHDLIGKIAVSSGGLKLSILGQATDLGVSTIISGEGMGKACSIIRPGKTV